MRGSGDCSVEGSKGTCGKAGRPVRRKCARYEETSDVSRLHSGPVNVDKNKAVEPGREPKPSGAIRPFIRI